MPKEYQEKTGDAVRKFTDTTVTKTTVTDGSTKATAVDRDAAKSSEKAWAKYEAKKGK